MEIKAKIKNLHIAPRKVRLVAHLIKKMSIAEADQQLQFNLKLTANPLRKLLQSAVANAVNNFHLKKEDLIIKSITVNEGFVLKRWKPRAMGRATQLKKRSTHVVITLATIKKEKKAAPAEKKLITLKKADNKKASK